MVQPQQDIVPQRIAEEPRHLRRISAARRDKEIAGRGDPLAIPADLTRIARQQAQQRAQERRLAGADPPGDHGQRAARQGQVTSSMPLVEWG